MRKWPIIASIFALFLVFLIFFLWAARGEIKELKIPGFQSTFQNTKKESIERLEGSKISMIDNSIFFKVNILNSSEKEETIFQSFPTLSTRFDELIVIFSDDKPAIIFNTVSENGQEISQYGYEVEREGKTLKAKIYINPDVLSTKTHLQAQLSYYGELMMFSALSRENARYEDLSAPDSSSLDESILLGRELHKAFRYLYKEGIFDIQYE